MESNDRLPPGFVSVKPPKSTRGVPITQPLPLGLVGLVILAFTAFHVVTTNGHPIDEMDVMQIAVGVLALIGAFVVHRKKR